MDQPSSFRIRTLVIATIAIGSLVILTGWNHKNPTAKTSQLIEDPTEFVRPELHENTASTESCVSKFQDAVNNKFKNQNPLSRFFIARDATAHFMTENGGSERGPVVVMDTQHKWRKVSSRVQKWIDTYLDGKGHVHKRVVNTKTAHFLFGDNTVVSVDLRTCRANGVYFADTDGNFHPDLKPHMIGARGNVIPSPVPSPPPPYRRAQSNDKRAAPGCNMNGNIALYQPARQSSTGWGGVPSRGDDGNTNQNYNGNSCTHTNHQNLAYWYVDLGQVVKICSLRIFNRQDCCWDRLNAFVIQLTMTPPVSVNNEFRINPRQPSFRVTIHGQSSFSSYRYNLERAYSARYVTIANVLKGRPPLTLCEVQVNGVGPQPILPARGVKYLGCHADCFNGCTRILRDKQRLGWHDVTIPKCRSFCGGYKYFMVEYSQECFCGNTLHSRGGSFGCKSPCKGNRAERCGGSNAADVFQNP